MEFWTVKVTIHTYVLLTFVSEFVYKHVVTNVIEMSLTGFLHFLGTSRHFLLNLVVTYKYVTL